jgi:exodeoxyribonuclease-3
MPLTVMTYNIRNGAPGERLDAVVRVIAAHRPDILVLQELRRFDRDGGARLRRLTEVTGLRAHLARSWLGQPVAVLVPESAAVIRAGAVPRPFHHAAIRVALATSLGPLTVIGTHLYPYSGRRRLWEARWLAAYADPAAMVLLAGDLNALDPWTDHTERLRGLPPRYRSRHLTRGSSSTVDTRAVRALTDAGLVDVGADGGGAADHTAPTEHGGGVEFRRMRLDYILATPPLAARALTYRVIRGGECETASDHYPVLAGFDLALVDRG